MPLEKLRRRDVRAWRDGLPDAKLSRAAANRTLAALRAALNCAVNEQLASPQLREEVRSVTAFENANRRRDLFLDACQRRKLLEATTGALRDLIEAACLTGVRPGELAAAKRGDFDARSASLTLTRKVGSRTIPLSPAAVALFERLSRSKLPAKRR